MPSRPVYVFDELSRQRRSGDKVAEERFYFDPVQHKPAGDGAPD